MIRRLALAALTLGLSACSVSAGLPHASFTTSRGTATPSTPSTPSSPSGPGGSDASANDNAAALVLVVPDVIGKTADEARAIVKAAGFTRAVELNEVLSCDGPRQADRISCQNPTAGTRVGRNDWVQVAVHTVRRFNTGNIEPEQIRPLVGRPLAEVKQRLRELGYVGHLDIRENADPTATCHDQLVCDLDQGGSVRIDGPIVVSLAIPPGAE